MILYSLIHTVHMAQGKPNRGIEMTLKHVQTSNSDTLASSANVFSICMFS